MALGKTVQIDSDLFLDLCNHFLNGDESNAEEIKKALSDKVEKIIDREVFSEYKRAPRDSAEREYFRQKYLNRKGVSRSFRTDTEISLLPPDDLDIPHR